ncbi:hybrid sensor histidine kinase/response regulator [Maritalea mediterranea]|uniref:histidine kinase n=1 Tax=Maritalea mediterranea TaxID=2909667 RepID=A0ABS9E8U7_9HYPH|nr:hybrid sensor histidine kinase/response regulator [Maritalea mediterranea]MCF4099293.1 response regulator [Maritalea mediterranea]
MRPEKMAPKGLHARLLLAFTSISLIPLLIVSATFFYVLIANLEGENFAKLEFVNEAKQAEIRQYLQFASRQADSLSQTNIVRYSIGEFYGFSYGFREISPEPEEAARILRAAFGVGGAATRADRDKLISTALIYDNMHAQFHGEYEAFLQSSEYDNLYLVNNQGRIVYSVEKDNYLATSIHGPLSNTPVAQLAQQLLSTDDEMGIVFHDFDHDPITNQFAAYLAVKVTFYSRPSGVVVFRLPTKGVERLVQSETRNAGQVFLLSSKGQVLSRPTDSRYNIGEKPNLAHQSLTTDKATAKVPQGLTNRPALAAFGAVRVFGRDWLLVSEVPTSVAYASVNTLIAIVSGLALLAIPVLFFIATRLARSATRPIMRITDTAEAIAAGDLNRTMPHIEKPIELKRLADSFGRMRDAVRDQLSQINANVAAIEEKNAQLEEADRMKDTFLANTSHELRTPLNGIVGISETLTAGAAGDLSERQRSQLQLITFSARKLSRLVDDLLDLYRIRQGQMRLDMHPVDVATSVRNVLLLSEPLLRGEPVTLEVDIAKDTPLAMADPVRLEQILHNLVGNAIKYTEAGTIRITAKAEQDHVDISIADTGMGISQEDLGRMFKPLVQADGVDTARKTGGTGLGLTIARHLATILGGELSADSTLGEGSVFTLTLKSATAKDFELEGAPAIARQSEGYQETLNSSDESWAEDDQPIKEGVPEILVVDDEPINLQVLRNVLLPQGFGVRTADNGATALEMIDKHRPNLVILDVMMPDLSGLEVGRRLRERFDRLELPIIMVTARSRTRDIIAGLEAGANDYVVKPFVKDELLARVDTLLEAQRSRIASEENAQLHAEMNRRIQVEDALRLSQNRMAGLLDSLQVGLWCVEPTGRLIYANRFTEEWLGIQAGSRINVKTILPETTFDLLLETCRVDGEALLDKVQLSGQSAPVHIHAFEMDQDMGEGLNIILLPPNSANWPHAQDPTILRRALDTIEVPNTSSRQPASPPAPAQEADEQRRAYRDATVKLMTQALDIWQKDTKQSKFDLAERSGIWRVHLDRSSLQTRTLDKYFSTDTLPQNPRWRDVLATADFVLKHCNSAELTAELEQLKSLRDQVKKMVMDGAAKMG